MTNVWPWLAVAGFGALHGLNPATGWMFAAAIGVRSGDRSQALRALVPIALGHAFSIGLVAAAVSFGLSMDREGLVLGAAILLTVATLIHVTRRKHDALAGEAGDAGGVARNEASRRRSDDRRPAPGSRLGGDRAGATPRKRARHVALIAWSCAVSTAHGSGLMLVPALIPLCSSSTPGGDLTASGSLTMALAVVAVHTAAMLAVMGVVAVSACRGLEAGTRWLKTLPAQIRLRT